MLRRSVDNLTGIVPNTSLKWAEAARVTLEYWFDRLWLVFEPTVWVEHPTESGDTKQDEEMHAKAREFVRARLAGRYNVKWNALLQAWSHIMTRGDSESEIRAFGTAEGVDAVFKISSITGFSWRESGR